jgi:hypothetical protein
MLGSDHERIARRLASILAEPQDGAAITADLWEDFTSLPDWMQNFLRPLLHKSVSGAITEKRSTHQAEAHQSMPPS